MINDLILCVVLYGPMKAFVLKIEDVQQIQDGYVDCYTALQLFAILLLPPVLTVISTASCKTL